MSSENKQSENADNTEAAPPQIDLLKVDIVDENTALNVLVGFLGLAQRRGVFAINESAKIFEAINKFRSSKDN